MWDKAKLTRAKNILGQHTDLAEGVAAVAKRLMQSVSRDSLDKAFTRAGMTPTVTHLKKAKFIPEAPKEEAYGDLLKAIRTPISFADLCDRMDLSPNKMTRLIQRAHASGIKVHVEHDHVGLKLAQPVEKVQETKISPTVGGRQKIAVISDTHLGSKYCLRAQLKEFVHYAYSQGVREILHPGDVLDGDYRHGKFEMSHMGIDAQTQDLFETLPRLPGLTYHGITGNHDHTFTAESGGDTGEFITNYFRARGREDFHFYGNRGAFLRVKGIVVHLWHPRSGGAYAISYPLQKKIEGYGSIKPQLMLCGHFHRYTHCYERNVHALACPTFQAGQSEFSKSLTGSPAIGGLLLSWDLTTEGTMRSFVVEKRSYMEVERPIDIYNDTDAIPVEIRSENRARRRK